MSKMASTSDSSGSEGTFTVNPSVSKEQWYTFSMRKLHDGFALVQGPNGKSFGFYKAGEPTQPCASHAARRLLTMGGLVPAKTDHRGTHYVLHQQLQNRPS